MKRRQGRLGDTWHLDEVFVTIQGRRQYLWRAVDQDGDVIDILVQSCRDQRAAKRFFRKLLKGQGSPPWRLVTDKLRRVIPQLTGVSCLPSFTAPSNTKTIGRKSPMSRHANASDRCDGSSPLVRRNDSYRSMESFRISSVSDVTCWGLPIIGSYEVEPFSFGMRQRVPDERRGQQLTGPSLAPMTPT